MLFGIVAGIEDSDNSALPQIELIKGLATVREDFASTLNKNVVEPNGICPTRSGLHVNELAGHNADDLTALLLSDGKIMCCRVRWHVSLPIRCHHY
jgi:hypothetical protein